MVRCCGRGDRSRAARSPATSPSPACPITSRRSATPGSSRRESPGRSTSIACARPSSRDGSPVSPGRSSGSCSPRTASGRRRWSDAVARGSRLRSRSGRRCTRQGRAWPRRNAGSCRPGRGPWIMWPLPTLRGPRYCVCMGRFRDRRAGAFGGVVLVASLGACVLGRREDPARTACFKHCAQQKDRCVVEATSAGELERCDQQSARCGKDCP
jgi:hypothetical protein